MVITNNNDHATVLDTKRFAERIKDCEMGVEVTSKQAVDMKNQVEIPGKTVLVLELGFWR